MNRQGLPRGRFDDTFLRKLEVLRVLAKRTRGESGGTARRGHRVGAGVEFADHRDYAAGDDVRALDWSLLARLDRPYVRLRQDEEDLTLSLIVDTSASMGTGVPAKLELAVHVAAALAYLGLAALDRVGVSLVAGDVTAALAPRRGQASLARVLDLLDQTRAAGRTNLELAARLVQSRTDARGRGLTVLISDLLDPVGCLPVLDRLRAARQDIIVLQVTASTDAAITGEGEVLLQDVETGETRPLILNAAARRAGAERYQGWLRGIASVCGKRGLPCFQIESRVPFEDVVLRILRGGGVLG